MGIWNKKPADDPAQSEKEKNELLDAFAAKMNETLDARLKPINDTVTVLKTKWEAVETSAAEDTAAAAAAAAAAADAELTPEDKLKKENRALFAQNVVTNARITEGQVVSEIEREWPEAATEFRRRCANTPVEVKARPDYEALLKKELDAIVGQQARAKGLKYDRSNKTFIIEDGATSNDAETSDFLSEAPTWQDPRNLHKTLTPKQQLGKMGIDPKKFAEWAETTGQVV